MHVIHICTYVNILSCVCLFLSSFLFRPRKGVILPYVSFNGILTDLFCFSIAPLCVWKDFLSFGSFQQKWVPFLKINILCLKPMTYASVYIYIYIILCVCLCVFIYVHTYIYKHTHFYVYMKCILNSNWYPY